MNPDLRSLMHEDAIDPLPPPNLQTVLRAGRRKRRVRGAAAATTAVLTIATGATIATTVSWTPATATPAGSPEAADGNLQSSSANCEGDGPLAVQVEDELGWTDVMLDGDTAHICAGSSESSLVGSTYYVLDRGSQLSDASFGRLASCSDPCERGLVSVVGVLPANVTTVTYRSSDGESTDAVLGDGVWAVRVTETMSDLGYEWSLENGVLTVTPSSI